MKSRIRKAIGLALLIIAPPVWAQAQSQVYEPSFTNDQPLSQTDMRKFGFRTPGAGHHYHSSLSFADNDHLIFTWTTLDDPHAEKAIALLTRVPSHLHAVVLTAHTGQMEALREWPAPSFFATIHPVKDGNLIICTGDAIRLLSLDFAVLREKVLPNLSICPDEEVSPSGRSFTLTSMIAGNYQKTLMDAETLAVLTSIAEPGRIRLTDSLLVRNCSAQQLCIRKLNEAWQPFSFDGIDQKMSEYRYKPAYFLNDSTLVVQAGNQIAVASVEGSFVFQVNLPNRWSFGSPVTSSLGSRFAVTERKLRGVTNPGLDMYAFPSIDHVVVYSLPERRAIYTRKLQGTSPWTPWTDHQNQLALSPDGTLLAVLDREILQIYRLPQGKF